MGANRTRPQGKTLSTRGGTPHATPDLTGRYFKRTPPVMRAAGDSRYFAGTHQVRRGSFTPPTIQAQFTIRIQEES